MLKARYHIFSRRRPFLSFIDATTPPPTPLYIARLLPCLMRRTYAFDDMVYFRCRFCSPLCRLRCPSLLFFHRFFAALSPFIFFAPCRRVATVDDISRYERCCWRRHGACRVDGAPLFSRRLFFMAALILRLPGFLRLSSLLDASRVMP